MSHDAYCLHLCRRALTVEYWQARPVSIARFQARVQVLAARLIGAGA